MIFFRLQTLRKYHGLKTNMKGVTNALATKIAPTSVTRPPGPHILVDYLNSKATTREIKAVLMNYAYASFSALEISTPVIVVLFSDATSFSIAMISIVFITKIKNVVTPLKM